MSPAVAGQRHRYAILSLLAIGVTLSYVDRTNLSIILANPAFQHAFQISDEQRGLLNSAFFWSYALLQVPGGWLVDRFGVRACYIVAFVVWSAATACSALTTTVPQLLAARIILGAGEALVPSASIRWIREHFSEDRRGLATGVYLSGSKIGLAIGAPATVWLASLWGWQGMFAVLGIGSLLWLVPWTLLTRHDTHRRSSSAAVAGEQVISFSSLIANPAIWGMLIGTFSYHYFVYFCMTWMPAYFVERRHLSLSRMGFYQFFSFAGMAAISVLAGWAADRAIRGGGEPLRIRKAFTIAGLLLATTELVGAYAASDRIAIAFAVISLAGLGLATANYWALTQTMVPRRQVGIVTGTQNLAGSLAGAVAPVLTGWLKAQTGSYSAPLYTVWIFLVLAIAGYVVLVRPRFAPRLA